MISEAEACFMQVKIHISSVNCGLDMPPSGGALRPCPIVIFDEVRPWPTWDTSWLALLPDDVIASPFPDIKHISRLATVALTCCPQQRICVLALVYSFTMHAADRPADRPCTLEVRGSGDAYGELHASYRAPFVVALRNDMRRRPEL